MVILDLMGITMDGISTMTQKGQIAIPKSIRDRFGLKTSSRVRFFVEGSKIIAEPALKVSDMFGVVSAPGLISKTAQKEEIRKAVLKKYASRS